MQRGIETHRCSTLLIDDDRDNVKVSSAINILYMLYAVTPLNVDCVDYFLDRSE